MADHEERRIGDFTVRIDRLLCVGFGDCIDEGPGVFRFDDEGIATFEEISAPVEPRLLADACLACPVDAITVFDAEGVQVVP